MSKKRTSSDYNNDEQPNEDLEPPIQREDDVKRVKLDPERVTTLQDLPLELLEGILFKVVVMEVKGLKLAKSVVISRLRPVCSLWSDILTTNSFRAKLHRTLDGTAQTVRLEILHEAPTHSQNEAMTSLKDETFMLYRQLDRHYVIKVYNRDNMEEVKEVIPLPGTDARHMTGCNVSNCVYICMRLGDSPSHEILRISRDVENKFIISPWINDTKLAFAMSVTANGSVVTLSTRREGASSDVVRIYNTDGSLEREVMSPL